MSAITYDDQRWLLNNQPGLFALQNATSALIQGVMRFHRTYKDYEIEDEYNIKLEVFEDKHPRIYETGGRLNSKLADDPDLKQVDLHMYAGGKLCVAAPQQLSLAYMPNKRLDVLFGNYIEPYFYSQSFHEEFGMWPWEHLPHGADGLVTWYAGNHHLKGAAAETVRELKKIAHGNEKAQFLLEHGSRRDSFAINNTCLCGSRAKFGQCHPYFWKLAHAIRYS